MRSNEEGQQGLPQYIQFTFPAPVTPKRLLLIFQGGFVGRKCAIDIIPAQGEGSGSSREWKTLCRVYPDDVNRQQSFELKSDNPSLEGESVEALKIVFEESSDFFGRITLYDLQLQGQTV
ncbi:hypothetical protein OE88DRAFT_68141 [Heliocybe sulcata]|uniref:SUN domain-containing protein n=1 Tax=Heliocybe sulcata TaxID=5364 RepID=A0A5C3NHV7_9AGAM|nr:hypothetical protein OE88DRAFT_68141 [Heliocybe sulcata]